MTLETEIAIAILNREQLYFVRGRDVTRRTNDVGDIIYNVPEGIPLPTPQRSGTSYQQETYARLKAREIINKYKLNKSLS